MTANRYTGERGDHYYVTVGSGKDEHQECAVDWPGFGAFQLFFDDVLTLAALQLPAEVMVGLEPWPLAKCLPFNPECLAGFQARTYDCPARPGICAGQSPHGRSHSTRGLSRIGGDEQRIDSLDTQHTALTYKHCAVAGLAAGLSLPEPGLPGGVNGATGEVQGQRPYSWIKITIAVVLAVVAVVAVVLMSQH